MDILSLESVSDPDSFVNSKFHKCRMNRKKSPEIGLECLRFHQNDFIQCNAYDTQNFIQKIICLSVNRCEKVKLIVGSKMKNFSEQINVCHSKVIANETLKLEWIAIH